MGTFIQDLRYGFRMLWKSPGFTIVALMALALGIGANTAIFSVVNTVLLRPLPYKTPERLVWLWETSPQNDIPKEVASYPNFEDWRQQNQNFEAIAGFTSTTPSLTGGDEPERVPGAYVLGDFYTVLGVEPVLGRKFLPEENVEGKHRVVILSHGLWQRHFGGDTRIVGQQVGVNGGQYTVVGVMPPNFQQPDPEARRPVEMWLPLPISEGMRASRRGDFLSVIARLKSGVSVEQARAEMTTIAARLEQQYPQTNAAWSVIVQPLHQRFTGDVRPALLMLLGAVGFLLLIACANVANLLLARSSTRLKEIAIRTALGAGRGRMVRQLLTESVVLSLAGGALGLLVAFWGIDALVALSPGNIPRLESVGIDRQVLLFTVGVSLVTGIVFGIAPALAVSNPNLNEMLKESGRSSTDGGRGRRLRNTLAVAEIALSLVLLVGAGLLVKSFLRLQDVKPGFNPQNLLAAELVLPSTKYAENGQVVNFYDQLLGQLAQQPGVLGATVTSTLPLSGGGEVLAFSVEGRTIGSTDRNPDAEARTVSPDYFRTLQIPLKSGRMLDERDNEKAPRAAVISETLARKYFPGEDPLGKRITFGDPQAPDVQWLNVVGVVGDVHQQGLDEEPYAQVYRSYRQSPRRGLTVIVRTAGPPLAMLDVLRNQIRTLDRQQPIYNARTAEQVLDEAIARPRFNMLLITILAAVAMILATVGIYGVISYMVTQRTHEIGIRMALGARPFDVFRMVLRQGLLIALLGVGSGLVAAFALTRLLASLLYDVRPTDVVTFISVSALLTAVVLLACYIPARRATKVDPMIALRYE
ncbi:MAG TPA: ABC transporter permease [Pyrinomonadaceae bacterium]|nr:ABC transporter permease [Pyrinomonadaceae bacterium]